jgi:predicted amidohydrolase YtcJ
MTRSGVALAFGSDSPVTPFDPWAAVRAAVLHRTETERIGLLPAFLAHTRGGWRAARRDEGGSLVPGAPASLAVWDVAPAAANDGPPLPDLHPDLDLPTCVLTLVGGEVAFESPGALE